MHDDMGTTRTFPEPGAVQVRKSRTARRTRSAGLVTRRQSRTSPTGALRQPLSTRSGRRERARASRAQPSFALAQTLLPHLSVDLSSRWRPGFMARKSHAMGKKKSSDPLRDYLRRRVHDRRIRKLSEDLVLSHHQLLTVSAQPYRSSRMQCNAGARKSELLRFLLRVRTRTADSPRLVAVFCPALFARGNAI